METRSPWNRRSPNSGEFGYKISLTALPVGADALVTPFPVVTASQTTLRRVVPQFFEMRSSLMASVGLLIFAAAVFALAGFSVYRAWARHHAETEAPAASVSDGTNQPRFAGQRPPSQLTIEATGREFAWNYRLAGQDGELDTADDVRVQDELHLPLDCDVELLVKSDDFVYTLSIPELELRKIAIPELVYVLQFRTTRPGTFDVVADPLCGVRWFHDEDMGRVVIESPREFQTWYGSVQ